MKKTLIILTSLLSLLMIGCGKKDDAIKKLKENIDTLNAYHIKGELEIVNSEDIYKYDVSVSYKAKDLFRVSLKNINNNHTQILLKNTEGVYVLTPSLNKSFKFQSDWPYNNSQIYLLQTILKDITDDTNANVVTSSDNYIITSKVKYANNSDLVKQNVYLDKNYAIKKVEVLDADNKVLMRMIFNNINTNPNFSEDYFDVNSSINVSGSEQIISPVSKIDSIIYPMYMPEKTYLSEQNKLSIDNGERVILTFDGDNPFMLVQETTNPMQELTTISTYGEPQIVGDTIGVIAKGSISWSSNGIDYYVTSNKLSDAELLSVANSIGVIPVGK